MSRGRHKFTQADITKAVKGVAAAGVDVLRVDVDPTGRISIVAGGAKAPTGNEWDAVYDEAASKARQPVP